MMFYKKILSAGAILSAGTLLSAAASTLVNVDFTKMTEVSDLPTGWTAGQWGGGSSNFIFNDNGAVASGRWQQNYLALNESLSLSDGDSYTITFETYATSTNNYQALFYLSSENGSLVVGNSYDDNIYTKRFDNAIIPTSSDFFTFQADKPATVTDNGKFDGLTISGGLSYTLTLTAGELKFKVSDGTNITSGTIEHSIDSFSSLGFNLVGAANAVGVKNITVTQLPEPSSFGLLAGLGALALVAARRRRSRKA